MFIESPAVMPTPDTVTVLAVVVVQLFVQLIIVVVFAVAEKESEPKPISPDVTPVPAMVHSITEFVVLYTVILKALP